MTHQLPRVALFLILAAGLLPAAASAQETPLQLVIKADTAGATINRHIYGHFAEHLGRNIYGGLWVKGDDGAWRLNEPVIEALRQINPPNIRWPGGCYADFYHWRDGIGPQADRPTIVNSHWGGVTEDNSFGTHEFMALVEALGAEPIIVGNVGSGTVQEMAQWWEYVNHPGPSPMADLRAENGRTEPWNVRFWGVGNESWGCGGNMRPEYYADVYKRFATFLPAYGRVRPFRIATGPDATLYDGMFEWTEVMMRDAGRMIDGLDMHYYTIVGSWDDRTPATDFSKQQWIGAFSEALKMEEHIVRVSEIMDRYDPRKRVWLIIGEWGMWHLPEVGSEPGFLYQQNALRDALVAGVHLNIFNRHADRVRMANIAQTVNVLQSMILTEREGDAFVLTPTYHVFEMFKGHQDAELLTIALDAGQYSYGGETIPALSASASRKDGRILLTLVNMDPDNGRTVESSVEGGRPTSLTSRILTAGSMNAHNTFEQPEVVVPRRFDGAELDGNRIRLRIPPMSVVAVEIE